MVNMQDLLESIAAKNDYELTATIHETSPVVSRFTFCKEISGEHEVLGRLHNYLFIVVRERTKMKLLIKDDEPIDVDMCVEGSLPVLCEFFANDSCNHVGIYELPPTPENFYSI